MDEDKDGFAAEYVLGTLDAEERAQADALILVDAAFAASVARWERRLGELNVLVAPVEPPAPLWERIKAGLGRHGAIGRPCTCPRWQHPRRHTPDARAPTIIQPQRMRAGAA